MTDNEIIKALKCCSKGIYAEVCEECAFRNEGNKINIDCFNLEEYALDLINRQKAEIEMLKTEMLKIVEHDIPALAAKQIADEHTANVMKYAKSKAIKEFAERLKQVLYNDEFIFTRNIIDNLVKEMVGDA